MNPYITNRNPGHPGVDGGPYKEEKLKHGKQEKNPAKVDFTGTGTFPPESQGITGRAQPTGLSAMTQYGIGSPGVVPGVSSLAGPEVHPLPVDAEPEGFGLAPEMQTQESLLEDEEEELNAQMEKIQSRKEAASQKGQGQGTGEGGRASGLLRPDAMKASRPPTEDEEE